MGETIQLTAADGHTLDAYLARPPAAPRGGVVVVQEIFGVNSHIRAVCDRFAAAEKAAEAGKVGIVGYCWGGLIVYVAACRMGDKLSCASGYYGGNIVSYLNEKPAVPLILHFGALDASIPMADIDRIRAAHPDMRVHVYEGADHGFNCDQRRQFNDEAARIAQRRTLDLFATHLA